MITELSTISSNSLSREKKQVIDNFLQNSRLDRIEASAALVKIYASLDSRLKPRVLFAEGPEQATELVRYFLGIGPTDSELSVLDITCGAYEQARNLSDEIFRIHTDAADAVKMRFNAHFSTEASRSLRNMVLYDLNFRIVSQVVAPIFKSLDSSLARMPEGYRHRPALYPSWCDADWTSFYALCDQCVGTAIETDSSVRDFITAGGFMVYVYDLFALVVDRPDCISRDTEGRLHAEEGPAVTWKDGTKIYFWHGLEVTAQLIEQPEKVTKQEVLEEKNAEIRRCYLEILGSERFGELLGLELLDQSADRYGNELKLYRTADRDKLAGDHIYFGAVVCPSTQRRYFLCVPPSIKSAREAVSWTFGKTPETYNPEIET